MGPNFQNDTLEKGIDWKFRVYLMKKRGMKDEWIWPLNWHNLKSLG
jgi:hypothetical protein